MQELLGIPSVRQSTGSKSSAALKKPGLRRASSRGTPRRLAELPAKSYHSLGGDLPPNAQRSTFITWVLPRYLSRFVTLPLPGTICRTTKESPCRGTPRSRDHSRQQKGGIRKDSVFSQNLLRSKRDYRASPHLRKSSKVGRYFYLLKK